MKTSYCAYDKGLEQVSEKHRTKTKYFNQSIKMVIHHHLLQRVLLVFDIEHYLMVQNQK